MLSCLSQVDGQEGAAVGGDSTPLLRGICAMNRVDIPCLVSTEPSWWAFFETPTATGNGEAGTGGGVSG